MTPMTATERLRRYRSHHRIEVDRSADWSRCDTDQIRVYQVLTRRWQHDPDELRKLENDAAREQLEAGTATFDPPCVGCGRAIPKGSVEDDLAILVTMRDGSLRPWCSYCQDRSAL